MDGFSHECSELFGRGSRQMVPFVWVDLWGLSFSPGGRRRQVTETLGGTFSSLLSLGRSLGKGPETFPPNLEKMIYACYGDDM